MKAIAAANPDIRIADISLKGPDGPELLKNVRTSYPFLPVLIDDLQESNLARCRPKHQAEPGIPRHRQGWGKA
jgi:hypothetical protein